MPELRRDPVVGRWVIISTERSRRPSDFAVAPRHPKETGPCVFCPGQESRTPEEILTLLRCQLPFHLDEELLKPGPADPGACVPRTP